MIKRDNLGNWRGEIIEECSKKGYFWVIMRDRGAEIGDIGEKEEGR